LLSFRFPEYEACPAAASAGRFSEEPACRIEAYRIHSQKREFPWPCIVRDGKFSIHVYARDHPPPHCHVYWNGNKAAVVDLMSLQVIVGDRLPRQAKRLVGANLSNLRNAWNRLNP
jgi:hypothetical protein